MASNGPYITVAAAAAGLIGMGSALYAYQVYRESTKPAKLPEDWTEVGVLSDIFIFPIKSCGPIKVDTAECSILGLKDGWLRDRIFMVTDEKYNFITARAYPEMLLVHPSVKGSVLTLEHVDMESVSIKLEEVIALQKPTTARVWGVEVPVYDCGWEVSEWLSRILQRGSHNLRLVYYASQKPRSLRGTTNKIYKFTKNDTGAFPDEVPFNIVNQSSIDELNSRMDIKVTPRSFRPNFVLKGNTKAFAEDDWKFVKIGENVFEVIKPCTRCVLTTIDPETGVRNASMEPLKTLKSYRQIEDPAVRRSAGDSPRMGLQMTLRSPPGRPVSVNDRIYIA